MRQLNVDIPDDLQEWIRQEAFARRIPIRVLVITALEKYRKQAERARKVT